MSDIQDLINSTHDQLRALVEAARYLDELSKSLSHVGNSNLANTISMVSFDVSNAAEVIRGNNSEAINIRFKEAQQSSANILGAALAAASK